MYLQEENYRLNIGTFKSILKPKKKSADINPGIIQQGVPVKPAKLMDVQKLLTAHFGGKWENRQELAYYKNVMQPNLTVENTDTNDEEEMCCGNINENE